MSGIKTPRHLSCLPVGHGTALPAPGKPGHRGGFQFYFEAEYTYVSAALSLAPKGRAACGRAEVEAGPEAATHLHSLPHSSQGVGLRHAPDSPLLPPGSGLAFAELWAPPLVRPHWVSASTRPRPAPGPPRAPPLSGLRRVPPPYFSLSSHQASFQTRGLLCASQAASRPRHSDSSAPVKIRSGSAPASRTLLPQIRLRSNHVAPPSLRH